MADVYDTLVIGGGFGGLGAAIGLAEAGARVVLCEALNYPGGCASTFSRDGHRFEAGATMFSGFDQGQLFARWADRYSLEIEVVRHDPVLTFRSGVVALDVPRDRDAWHRALLALPGAPVADLERFLVFQAKISKTLWDLFSDPDLLPPLTLSAVLAHARRSPRYLPLARLVGRSLESVLRRFGLADFEPLRTWLDAVCQITVQVPAHEAEAPFALAAMDYFFEGCVHLDGGIGTLAEGLVGAIRGLGGDVRLSSRVRHLRRDGSGWVARVRGTEIRAKTVIAGVLPQQVAALTGETSPRLDALARQVAGGWSAALLYLVLDPDVAPPGPKHLHLVDDPNQAFLDGNHVLCSIGEVRDGRRTATVSTHVRVGDADPADVADVHDRMRATLLARAPEVVAAQRAELTASPRTLERFTRRESGLVGGIPRRVGVAQYLEVWPRQTAPGLWLVGDTMFPGQSTLATAVGGLRVAEAVRRWLRVKAPDTVPQPRPTLRTAR